MAGFCSTGLIDYIKDQIGACDNCAQTKILMKGDSTLAKAMKTLYGPDDFLGQAASTDPMSIVSCDEAGPFYIQDHKGGYKTTYILACVEILSYRVHLIPLPKLDTIHFLRALEILQSTRGRFTTLILDDHTSTTNSTGTNRITSQKSKINVGGSIGQRACTTLGQGGNTNNNS